MVENGFDGFETAVMHVRRCKQDVAERRHAETAFVRELACDFFAPKVRKSAVEAVVMK
ncbi:hypothetical protein D3C86_2224670 [compost metagenome]